MKKPLLSSSFSYKEQDPDYKGEPLDLDYTQQPVARRPCNDMLCCLIFMVYIGFMLFIAVRGYQTGDPTLLALPLDYCKNKCGVDSSFEQYKKVYITNLKQNRSDITFVCVKQCPSKQQILDCKTNTIISDCSQLEIYDSQTVVNFCLPKIKEEISFSFDKYNITVLQEYFSDLRDAKYLLLINLLIAFLASILFTFLMRWFAGCFLWAFIVLFISFLAIVGVFTFSMSQVQFLRKLLNHDSLPQNLKNTTYQKVCGSLCLGTALITLIIVCCMKRQIKISIGIIKAASDFVRSCCSAILIPVYVSILQALLLAWWTLTLLFIFSSKDSDRQPIQNTPFSMIVWNQEIQKLTIAFTFGFIWILFFFEGLGAFWISSTVAIWYFEFGQPTSPIIRSIGRSFKSFGSIAFGSLLLAIVTVAKIILQYINAKAKKSTLAMGNGQAAVMSFLIKCAACCIACFQRLIRFLTQNAYIMMAITGKNFCSSARQSFYLIVRCAGQFAISHNTTKLFMGLGKTFIVTICCVIGYIFITNIEPYKSQIYEPIFLTIIFAVISFPIASAFMGLFQMAANTLLICYCIEIDLSKGRSRCPQALKIFIEEYVQSSSLMEQIQKNH